jgi:hypothetical protein
MENDSECAVCFKNNQFNKFKCSCCKKSICADCFHTISVDTFNNKTDKMDFKYTCVMCRHTDNYNFENFEYEEVIKISEKFIGSYEKELLKIVAENLKIKEELDALKIKYTSKEEAHIDTLLLMMGHLNENNDILTISREENDTMKKNINNIINICNDKKTKSIKKEVITMMLVV